MLGCFAAFAVLLAAFIGLELRSSYPMLDLSLLRKPAFTGGLVAAFAVNGSIFSLLTYLTLYQQNILGFSALSTGLHFLVLTGALFLISGVAGRLSSHLPVRTLIAPGFVLIGAGLLMMRGINVSTGWTHLIPGFVLTGLGAGLVNTPLASTAVGVVDHTRAGMASGINSTLRQVGTATGVAALGSLLATQSRSVIVSDLAHTPLARSAHTIAAHITSGGGASARRRAQRHGGPRSKGRLRQRAQRGDADRGGPRFRRSRLLICADPSARLRAGLLRGGRREGLAAA